MKLKNSFYYNNNNKNKNFNYNNNNMDKLIKMIKHNNYNKMKMTMMKILTKMTLEMTIIQKEILIVK